MYLWSEISEKLSASLNEITVKGLDGLLWLKKEGDLKVAHRLLKQAASAGDRKAKSLLTIL